MAQGMLPSLFGVPPVDPELAAEEARAAALAKAGPFEAAAQTAYAGGAQAGRGLAQAIGGLTGRDTRSPYTKRAENIEAVRAAITAADVQPGSDDYYRLVITEAKKRGLIDEANATITAWDAAKKDRAQTGAFERSHQPATPAPLRGKDRLYELYQETSDALAEAPGDASLTAKKAALEKALAIKDTPASNDWVVVPPTKYSPGYKYNKRDGTTQPLKGRIADADGEPTTPVVPSALPPTTIPADVRADFAAGTSGFLGGKVNTIADLFGWDLPYPNLERGTQALTSLRVRTIAVAQDAVPGRPSNLLLQLNEQLSVEPGALMTGDQRARERFRSTRNLLAGEVSRIERDILARPKQFSKPELSKARVSYSGLRQLLVDYDTILASFQKQQPGASAGAVPPPPPGFNLDSP